LADRAWIVGNSGWSCRVGSFPACAWHGQPRQGARLAAELFPRVEPGANAARAQGCVADALAAGAADRNAAERQRTLSTGVCRCLRTQTLACAVLADAERPASVGDDHPIGAEPRQ